MSLSSTSGSGSDSDYHATTPPTSSRSRPRPQPPPRNRHPSYQIPRSELPPSIPLPSSSNTASAVHTPAQPPRLPSPRLFRAWFSTSDENSSRRQITLPPASFDGTGQDVTRAFQSANRAVRTAQEAFQSTRPTTDNIALDLTESSPGSHPAQPTFQHAAHLHTRSSPRHLNPTSRTDSSYPLPVHTTLAAHYHNLWNYLPRLHGFGVHELPSANSDLNVLQDQEAIHRQRDNHRNWQRTQARNRERNHNQPETMSPPRPSTSNSQPSPKTSRRPMSQNANTIDPAIESVDLTEVDDSTALSSLLAKQRQDAILAQNAGNESGRTPFTAYKCPVCMESPTDATTTVCGHVFCHRCIVDTLKWSIEQRRHDLPANRKTKGVCPVCRKPLDIKDTGTGRHLIPLEIKLMVRLKRKRDEHQDKGKGKARLSKVETLSSDDDNSAPSKKRNKENIRAGKARQRESTEEALWGELIEEPPSD
ncbi:hypothetical protein PV10_04452 [Exophiala mesophila]|uniref:RING-type domain-containing protein n=1 Tax=Exophiala mesophila TaxID=212818 RepID=A0A0D1ZEQ8_EXOME|nr:uncharacterized protein PV10_04452 [Exophiala mesophila]KIV93217.1 hypothetical protein PV10_04452 [Exophiala mesophila]